MVHHPPQINSLDFPAVKNSPARVQLYRFRFCLDPFIHYLINPNFLRNNLRLPNRGNFISLLFCFRHGHSGLFSLVHEKRGML